MMRILLILAVALTMGSTVAATVELTVLDEDGHPVSNIRVMMRPYDRSRATRSGFGSTDSQGVVAIQIHEALRYEVRVVSGERQSFVTLPDHPLSEAPSVTVEKGQEKIEATVTLTRGSPVVFRATARQRAMPQRHFVLYDLDRNYKHRFTLTAEQDEKELRLPRGRWRVEMTPVPGFLLRAVEVDREKFDGHAALFEIDLLDKATHVSFEYDAPAIVYGKVTYRGQRFGARVHAELLEAGDWLEAVQARGGSKYDSVDGFPRHPTYDYEMVVPSGRWRIQPAAPGLTGSEPEQMEIELNAGEEYQADFTVWGVSSSQPMTVVDVRLPDGQYLDEGWVEVWQQDESLRNDGPIAQERIRFGRAYFRSLPIKPYLFLAGAEGFVEVAEVATATQKNGGYHKVKLVVGVGAALHAAAEDESGVPVEAIQVGVTRLDESNSQMERDQIRQWEERPHGETDSTGHLWIRGIYPGRYELKGSRQTKSGDWQAVEFNQDGGDWARSLELSFEDVETVEIDLRIASAASLETRLYCSDGSELSQEADAFVFPSNYSEIESPSAAWNDAAAITTSNHVLKGRHRDRLHVGPIDSGSYRIVVRPDGHNRWTWAVGTERSEEAALISIDAPRRTDIGATPIDCEPAIAIIPVLRDGSSTVDWFAVEPYEPAASLTGEVQRDPRDLRAINNQYPLVYPREVEFRSLPTGAASLSVVVRSPFFLPDPEITIEIEEELERGRTITRRPQISDVGGAVKVDFSQPPLAGTAALRLLQFPGIDRLYSVNDETILIPSLPAGDYELKLCLNSECSESTRWESPIRIESGKITLIGSS
jgi:protocatechuate 3,4-dioxygenase beta subunit